MKFFLLLISLFPCFCLAVLPIDLKLDFENIKINKNGFSCEIKKEDLIEANEHVLKIEQSEQGARVKVSLALLELRINQRQSIDNMACSLLYVGELFTSKSYNQKNAREFYNDEKYKFEFSKVINEISENDLYKKYFFENVLNDSKYEFIYEPFNTHNDFYNNVNLDTGRRLFYFNSLKHNENHRFTKSDLNNIFKYYYDCNLELPVELKNILKKEILLNKILPNNEGFETYLEKATNKSYDDFFKSVFVEAKLDQFNDLPRFFLDISKFEILFKKFLENPFFPDDYKCNYSKMVTPIIRKNLKSAENSLFKSINHPCFNLFEGYENKFQIDQSSKPIILYKEGDNLKEIMDHIDPRFFKTWHDYRTKCKAGDKCTSVNMNDGDLNYINSKFIDDIPIFKAFNRRENTYSELSRKFEYDLKIESVCSEKKGECVEKDFKCDVDYLKNKFEFELEELKFKDCKLDSDCYLYSARIDNCSEYSVNFKVCIDDKDTHCRLKSAPAIFLDQRVEQISNQCEEKISGSFSGYCNPKLRVRKQILPKGYHFPGPKCIQNKCGFE